MYTILPYVNNFSHFIIKIEHLNEILKIETMPKNLIFSNFTKQNIHFTDVNRIKTKSYLNLADRGIEITVEREQIKKKFEAITELWPYEVGNILDGAGEFLI